MRDTFIAAAVKLGIELREVVVRSPADIDTAVRQAKDQGAHALYVSASGLAYIDRKQVADAALANRLPTSVFFSEQAEAGALMSYANGNPEHFRLAALYVDKLLRGTKPADLPVQQPDRYEFVINRKTAKALGLTIPQQCLLRADRLIE